MSCPLASCTSFSYTRGIELSSGVSPNEAISHRGARVRKWKRKGLSPMSLPSFFVSCWFLKYSSHQADVGGCLRLELSRLVSESLTDSPAAQFIEIGVI